MIISRENRYIFIAVPKTGTTSIQQLLLENDPTARRYGLKIGSKKYSFEEHDTALKIKTILGEEYAEYRTFGFIRNPYSRIVSSYFFYKNGRPITSGNQEPWTARFKIAYSRVIPFKFWAVSYPYKSNIEHFVDENKKLIVDFVGTFENLQKDLSRIFRLIDLDIPMDQLKHTNKSDHSSYKKYFDSKIFVEAVKKRIHADLDFYNKYKFNL